MKVLVAVLALAAAVLGFLYFNAKSGAERQLALASNDVAQAQRELTAAQEQLTEVQRTATEEHERSQQLLAALTNQLATVQTEVQEKQQRIDALEQKNATLESEIEVVTRQIMVVDGQLTQLEATHETTVENLKAMRDDYVRLVKEKAALEAKLHDLKALRAQIRVVKDELHAQRVAERQRIDRAETALGNGGFVFKEGAWTSVPKPPAGKYPLTEEITRP